MLASVAHGGRSSALYGRCEDHAIFREEEKTGVCALPFFCERRLYVHAQRGFILCGAVLVCVVVRIHGFTLVERQSVVCVLNVK